MTTNRMPSMIDGRREQTAGYADEYSPRAHELRVRVRVVVRPNHMGQALAGRLFASGTHEFEVFESDVADIERLVEHAEDEVVRASARHVRKMAAYVSGAKGRDAREYAGSPSEEFRAEMERDILPVTSVEVIGSPMESLAALALRRRTESVQSHAPKSTLGADIVAALMAAGMIAIPAPAKASK